MFAAYLGGIREGDAIILKVTPKFYATGKHKDSDDLT